LDEVGDGEGEGTVVKGIKSGKGEPEMARGNQGRLERRDSEGEPGMVRGTGDGLRDVGTAQECQGRLHECK
jgi:hypothetical protein